MKEIIFEHFVTIWRCVVGKCQYFAIYSLCCLFYSFVAHPISLLLLPCPCYTSLPPPLLCHYCPSHTIVASPIHCCSSHAIAAPTMPLLSLPYHRCLSYIIVIHHMQLSPSYVIIVPPQQLMALLCHCCPSHCFCSLHMGFLCYRKCTYRRSSSAFFAWVLLLMIRDSLSALNRTSPRPNIKKRYSIFTG